MKENTLDIGKQLDDYKNYYKDDFLVRIRNQRYQHELYYIKLYQDGNAELHMGSNRNYNFIVPEEIFGLLLKLAECQVQKYMREKHDWCEDDRCYNPEYALDFGFKIWGYEELNGYADHTFYFLEESEFEEINKLLSIDELKQF